MGTRNAGFYVTAEERIRRLKEFGVTDKEMKEAVEEVQRVQRDRNESMVPKRFVVVAKTSNSGNNSSKKPAASPFVRRRRSWRRAVNAAAKAAGPSENNSIGTRRAINKYRKYTAAAK